MKACKHCKRWRFIQGRGLCQPCHRVPAIRNQYPLGGKNYGNQDPTEEELDALIAEQMKCLPPWWDASEKHEREKGEAERPPRVYSLGR